jgi:hypothetical protein
MVEELKKGSKRMAYITYIDENSEEQWNWTFIGLWFALNVFPLWYVIYSNRRVKPDPVRDANFKPFVRFDYPNWSYFIGTFFAVFTLLKFLVGWISFFMAAFSVALAKKTKSDPTQPLVGWPFYFANLMTRVFFRFTLFMAGLIWCEKK